MISIFNAWQLRFSTSHMTIHLIQFVFLVGGLMTLIMPETGFKPTPREERSSYQQMLFTFRAGLRIVRLRPALKMVVAVGLFYGLYSEGVDRLFTPHMLTNFTFPAVGNFQPVVWFGLMNAVVLGLRIVVTEGVRRRVDTSNRKPVVRALFWLSIPMVASLIDDRPSIKVAAVTTFNSRSTPAFSRIWSRSTMSLCTRAAPTVPAPSTPTLIFMVGTRGFPWVRDRVSLHSFVGEIQTPAGIKKRSAPVPGGSRCRVLVGADHTTEPHGLIAVVMVVVMQTALMCQPRYPTSGVTSMGRS
jgi:hypothetical protein